MKDLPFNPHEVVAERPAESAADRHARLEEAVRAVVAVHLENLVERPTTQNGYGVDPVLDAGREAIWLIDHHILDPGLMYRQVDPA